jgi:poly(A) polymerase Pap1
MSYQQTAEENHNIKAVDKSFMNVVKFKYLGIKINQNCMHKEIRTD